LKRRPDPVGVYCGVAAAILKIQAEGVKNMSRNEATRERARTQRLIKHSQRATREMAQERRDIESVLREIRQTGSIAGTTRSYA